MTPPHTAVTSTDIGPDEIDAAPAARVLGVDVGGTRLKWVVLVDGSVVGSGILPTPRAGWSAVAEIVRTLIRDHGIEYSVGIGLPGPIPATDDKPLFVPNLPGDWRHVTLADLRRDLGNDAYVVNDATGFGLAELELGAARDARDAAAFLTLGTGVGGALAIGGRLHAGAHGAAGRLGHVVVDVDGPPCVCGGRGCVEAYAGESALLDAGGQPSAERLAGAARAGDARAAAAFERAGRALGACIATICVIVDPGIVVIGGGIAGALDLMRPALEREFRTRSSVAVEPEFATPAFETHSGAVGAALAARSQTKVDA